MNEETTYYTVNEVAERYGITNRMVRYWIANGLLEAERTTPSPKSNYRISADALADLDARAKDNS